MTPPEAFKFGFMARCLAEGLTDQAEMLERAESAMAKRAIFGVETALSAVRGLGGLGLTALTLGIPVAALAPPVLGMAAGNLAGRATDIDDYDVDEARMQELVDEYRRQSTLARQQAGLRRQQAARLASGRVTI